MPKIVKYRPQKANFLYGRPEEARHRIISTVVAQLLSEDADKDIRVISDQDHEQLNLNIIFSYATLTDKVPNTMSRVRDRGITYFPGSSIVSYYDADESLADLLEREHVKESPKDSVVVLETPVGQDLINYLDDLCFIYNCTMVAVLNREQKPDDRYWKGQACTHIDDALETKKELITKLGGS